MNEDLAARRFEVVVTLAYLLAAAVWGWPMDASLHVPRPTRTSATTTLQKRASRAAVLELLVQA